MEAGLVCHSVVSLTATVPLAALIEPVEESVVGTGRAAVSALVEVQQPV